MIAQKVGTSNPRKEKVMHQKAEYHTTDRDGIAR